MENINQFLKEITDLNAVPGDEKEVREYMANFAHNLSFETEVSYDNLGSVIIKKTGKKGGSRVLICGHMDEVGFMVTSITNEGFIKFIPLGGWWGQVMLAQQVKIKTKKGLVHGVIGSKPPHILSPEERNQPAKIENMFIDLGVASKEEALNLGVEIGSTIIPSIDFREMGNSNYLMAKAWDNRIGCAIALHVLENLAGETHSNEYFACGTVQEEVGCRGAITVANVVKPDLVVAIDVGIANDVPGGDKENMEMGKGPQILLYDAGLVGHRAFRDYLIKFCDELKIHYQLSFLKGGGTDAGKMHVAHSGAPSVSLCIPSRYIHSHTSMIHKQDYLDAVKLLTELVKRVDKKTIDEIVLG